jgi:hypothetical protein
MAVFCSQTSILTWAIPIEQAGNTPNPVTVGDTDSQGSRQLGKQGII